MISSASVFVIDDDPDNAESLTLLLHLWGCRAILCRSATEVLDAVEREQPDAVVSDLLMPDVDGYEATRLIRRDARFAELPIVALTAKAMQGDREKGAAAGMTDFVTKPVDNEQLLAVLNHWLGR